MTSIKTAQKVLKPLIDPPDKPSQVFLGLEPSLLKSARASLSPTQTKRVKNTSLQSNDLTQAQQKLTSAHLARKKIPYDPRVNSLARYYETNNADLNELARKRYAVSEYTALKNARDLDHDINPVRKNHSITSDYIKQIAAFTASDQG